MFVPKPPILSADEVNKELRDLAREFSVAEVCEDTGSTPRAIENVRAGECGMAFYKVVNWSRRNPRTRARVMRLLGCEGETDPDFLEGLHLLIQAHVRRDSADA